ncbi:MAG TPA: hypothetical protein VMQ78_02620 [Candidatus Limnocylindria bacterium]|nr:hypothetical protein [Candidatus Limnocylindria bacterium]
MSFSFRGKKVLLAAGAGALTAALLGSAALAAFAPVSYDPITEVEAQLGSAAPAHSGPDRLRAILDALAARGVITAGQVDAIIAAVRDAHPEQGAPVLRRILAGLLDASAKYLGLTTADLRTKLPGTSIGAVADATPGKSRAGLVSDLQSTVNAAIDRALAANAITQEQSDRAKAAAPAQVTRFVDHVYPERRAPKPAAPALRVAQFIGDVFGTAREYLGLSQPDLIRALREGKSLGDVASATAGKSRDGLVAHLTTAANARIDKATTDGRITADQAAALKAQVGPAVTAVVDRKGPTANFKR